MTNPEIRLWYLREIAKIKDLNLSWVARGDSPELRARQAWSYRRRARLQARSLMRDVVEQAQIRERDRAKYGDPDGPSFELLMERLRSHGIHPPEALEIVIQSAQRTDGEFDKIAD